MNYVHNSLMFLISVMSNVITWLFSTEIVNYQNVSISFGAMFIYFFIVYIVISFLLGARFGNIGATARKAAREKSNSSDRNN